MADFLSLIIQSFANSNRGHRMNDRSQYDVSSRLDAGIVKSLSQLRPWRSLLQVALEWGYIIFAIAAAEYVWDSSENIWLFLPAYLLSIVWIATRQHAMGVLLHEAVHTRLACSKMINDFIGEWLLAWPLQISLWGYRRQHFLHHRAVGEDDDPDCSRMRGVEKYTFPMSPRQIYFIIVKYILGFYSLYDGREAMEHLVAGIPKRLQATRIALYAAMIALSIYFDFWLGLILYWIIPSSTFLFLFMYIRLVGEHGALKAKGDIFEVTRHVDPTWLERWLIAPNHVNYHLDHHLYASIPFYNLPKLHDALLDNEVYRRRATITRGYFRGLLFDECL